MGAAERSLRARCAKFREAMSALDPARLTQRQRQVGELRIANLTLAEIATRIGVSSERVRQVEARLRSLSYIEKKQKTGRSLALCVEGKQCRPRQGTQQKTGNHPRQRRVR